MTDEVIEVHRIIYLNIYLIRNGMEKSNLSYQHFCLKKQYFKSVGFP